MNSDFENELQRDFKGIWVPKKVWLDKSLNALDKIILVEIDSLDNSEKGCYASNKYLAEFCQCSEAKITKSISKLIKLGYLYIQNFDGRRREIKSFLSQIGEAELSHLRGRVVKNTRQGRKKYEAGSEKIRANNIDNNIDNNTDNKKVSKKEGTKNSFPGDDLSFSNDNFMISDLKKEINHNKTSDRISVSNAIKEQKKLLVGTKHDKASNKTSEPINADKGKELEGLDLNNAKRAKAESFDSIISNYSENPRLKAAILDYIKMRKLVKSPLTNRALNLVLNRLQKLSSSEDEQIAILEQSIVNCWKGVFPLRNDNTIGTSSGANNSKNNKNVKPARELNEYEKQNKEMLMALWGIKNDK